MSIVLGRGSRCLGVPRTIAFSIVAAGALGLAAGAGAADLCDGLVQDKLPHALTSLAKPAPGQAVADPQFPGAVIRRITAVPNGGTNSNSAIKPMYSTVSAWNADESLLILYRVGQGHLLYDGRTYGFIRNLNISPADLEEIYWHTSDPDVLYFVNTRRLIRYRVNTDTQEVVRSFDFCTAATDGGDDPMFMSWDSDRIGLTCGGQHFIYTISTDTITPTTPKSSGSALAPQVAPSGSLAFWKGDVTDVNLNVLRTLSIDPFEHASLGRLPNGRDTYNGVQFEGSLVGSLLTFDMTTGTGRVVVGEATGYPYPPGGTHISTMSSRGEPGWVWVSIVGDVVDGALLRPLGQAVLDSEIVLADTKPGGKVCRVAHHRSHGRGNTNPNLRDKYWAEPHVMASPSGTRAVFASDWQNGPTVDTYVIELPSYVPPGSTGVELSITQSDSPDPVLLGDDVTYTLNVANGGSANAGGVRVVHTLPPGLTFVSSNPGAPTCRPAGGTLTCNLGSLAGGASTAISVVASGDVVGNHTVQALVTGSQIDTNPGNNSDPETTSVQPGLSIGDVTVIEGNSGSASAVFNLTLSATSPQAVTVSFATANGSASAGSDYVASSGGFTIPANTPGGTLSVAVKGDTTVEGNEIFFVNLSGAAGAILIDGQGRGTITNDDVAAAPSLSIGDVSVVEGNGGTVSASFALTLSGPATGPVTLTYGTSNGTAIAGSDYFAAGGTLVIAPGVTSANLPVAVKGDTAVEGDETFFLNLSGVSGASLADGQGRATILNDDSPPAEVKAQIVSPPPGSTFLSSSVTFDWTAGVGVSAYVLQVGSRPGGRDIFFGGWRQQTSATVNGIPTDGRIIYVRLWSVINGRLQFADYTYRAKGH